MFVKSKLDMLIVGMLVTVFVLSILKLHICTQITIMGYKIGELKNKETYLIEQQNLLKMELAKLTNKENLIMMAIKSHNDENKSKLNTIALKD